MTAKTARSARPARPARPASTAKPARPARAAPTAPTAPTAPKPRAARSAPPRRSARSAQAAQPERPAPSALPAPSAPSAPPARLALPPQLVLDENPRRAVTSINVRHDDKALFDRLQAWWSMERGRQVSQWEAFTLLVAAALAGRGLELPEEIRLRLA